VSTTVRVLVVDDQRLVREGVSSLLALEPGIEVVGSAADGEQAVRMAVTLRPHVVLMDVRMPVTDGVEATIAVRKRAPDVRVVMLTTFDDEDYVLRALRAGASGYLLKDLPAADLARAVRLAHAGVDQFDPAATGRLLAALHRSPASDPATDRAAAASRTGLTLREVEVLRLIARGATNREIASRLVVSEGTVKNHVSHILARLGLRDRTQAALHARDQGLL
jgi:DNA-binding NarL/FixJ family response regulator